MPPPPGYHLHHFPLESRRKSVARLSGKVHPFLATADYVAPEGYSVIGLLFNQVRDNMPHEEMPDPWPFSGVFWSFDTGMPGGSDSLVYEFDDPDFGLVPTQWEPLARGIAQSVTGSVHGKPWACDPQRPIVILTYVHVYALEGMVPRVPMPDQSWVANNTVVSWRSELCFQGLSDSEEEEEEEEVEEEEA